MKKFISTLAIALLFGAATFAQENPNAAKKAERQERMRAEKAAFIVSQLNLSEAEAQKFWPVYNEVQNERMEAQKKVSQAMKAMRENAETGADCTKLINDYIAAKKDVQAITLGAPAKYLKVLSSDKVAKLITCEEKFRHQQIGKLGEGPGKGPKGPRGERPHRDMVK
ncbi:MAG: hypothetical protein J5835_07340 [Bacteroidales bacterium]|nr:hypothetical protein [Bacteroidales bacterium]